MNHGVIVDRLAELIFKVLLFMTTPWFFIYSLMTRGEESEEDTDDETYTLTIGKVVYEFNTWQELLDFVRKYDRNNR